MEFRIAGSRSLAIWTCFAPRCARSLYATAVDRRTRDLVGSVGGNRRYKPIVSLAPSTGPRTATGTRQLRVLVVDDDRMQLRAIERVLRDQHEVDLTVADNAIDAMIAVGALKPDLVIMDILMPGLDGIEACRRVKANPETRDIQIVLASAMMTPELERAARHAGARRVMAKPVDLIELVGAAAAQTMRNAAGEPEPVLTIRGANLVVEMLAQTGVEIVFGLPGGAISP